jgi:arylsulfatase A-like enzyme
MFSFITITIQDALNPRRPENEQEFFKLGHHERTPDEATMNKKIQEIKDRRKWSPYDINQLHVQNILEKYRNIKRPNILMILADDLGYGDLSVPPFINPINYKTWPCDDTGILTPNLEKMASNGMILTNFHSASPVCSPSRVAIMTSLYPWRLNAMNAFELGHDLSQRNGFLPQVSTLVEIFREAGYYTAHSGKWHLGGMREEMRIDRAYHDNCSRGSPNQHGFEEYVSELDGPESPRYTFLNRNSILHSKGHRHLLKDDVPMPIIEKLDELNVLSDREAEDAVRVMKYVNDRNLFHFKLHNYSSYSNNYVLHQPWFIQVWFNAPHGPWEVLRPGEDVYSQNQSKVHEDWMKMKCPQTKVKDLIKNRMEWKYKTMVSAMDKSIGMLLKAIKDLGLEQDTLIMFTSDNGQENGAGSAGPFREGKRSLLVSLYLKYSVYTLSYLITSKMDE